MKKKSINLHLPIELAQKAHELATAKNKHLGTVIIDALFAYWFPRMDSLNTPCEEEINQCDPHNGLDEVSDINNLSTPIHTSISDSVTLTRAEYESILKKIGESAPPAEQEIDRETDQETLGIAGYPTYGSIPAQPRQNG